MATRKATAVVAALLALGDVLWVASAVVVWQEYLWPLPGLYLLEWLALGGLTLWAVVSTNPKRLASQRALPWFAAGAMLAFNILGVFSIGLPLLPATLGFLLAGALSSQRPPARWLLVIPLTAIVQTTLMLIPLGLFR